MITYKNISTRRIGGVVLEISLDKPRAKNALTLAMYTGLSEILTAAQSDVTVRVVVLRGNGGNFTSGNDLTDFMQSPPVEGEDSPVFRFLRTLIAFEKPIIAAVDGWAIGVGATMLLHCDLVYAASNARFQLPFVNLAVVPEAASTLLLPRLVGQARAAELLYFGDPFSAEDAHEMGLVNALFEPEALFEEVSKRALRLADKAPIALIETKRLLRRRTPACTQEVEEALVAEGRVFVERLASKEFAEAVAAFFEKRKPDFG